MTSANRTKGGHISSAVRALGCCSPSLPSDWVVSAAAAPYGESRRLKLTGAPSGKRVHWGHS